MKFDWYQATIEREPDWIKSALMEASGGEWVTSTPTARSERTDSLCVDGEPILDLYQGGRYMHPHAKSTGSRAHAASTIIRTGCPEHLVARADVCEDLEAPGWFDHAFGVMRDLALAKGMKPERVGDWDSPQTSRTFRVGSPTSPVLCRLYEKGMEQRAKNPQHADDYSPDWSRLEVQVRPPKREAKLSLASRPASEFWGCAKWTRTLAAQLLDVDAPRVDMASWTGRSADLERREFFMVSQYASTLLERADLVGSDAAAGEYIMRLVRAHIALRN